MPECQVPQPKSGAPLLCIVRYADISVRPNNPAIRPVPGGIEVDLQKILTQNPPGGFGIIFSETTEAICRQRGDVVVVGANPGIEALVKIKVREHYEKYCECQPPGPPPYTCDQFGVGSVGNLYRVTWKWNGTEIRNVDGECEEFPFEQVSSGFLWGPLSDFRNVREAIGENICGTEYSNQFYAKVGAEGNPCKPQEELISSVLGTITATAAVTQIDTIVDRFPEVCPPVACTTPPPIGDEPQAPPFIEEEDDPPLPPGEEAVTTIVIEGEPGKDGKSITLGAVRTVPYSTGFSQAILTAETETERVYELELQEQLEAQPVSIQVGTCDIVNSEFTEAVVDAVLPIIGGSPGWGAVIAAIASMVFEVAKDQCQKDSPPVNRFGGEFISPVLEERQVLTINVPQPLTEFEEFEVFIGISGQGQPLPTTIDIDTFDQLGSEGVWGVAYLMGEFGVVEANPHLLRFPVSYLTGTWQRFRGIKLALPAGSQCGVNFNYKVKPE